MAKTNTKTSTPVQRTHGGAVSSRCGSKEELMRSVCSCLLWEDEFYESGEKIADRIAKLSASVDPRFVSDLAVKARSEYNLRHAPLWMLTSLLENPKGRPFVSDAVFGTVQRADELAEILAMYWKGGKRPLANSLKKGLARAFTKFDEYQLAKYNRDGDIKLRDVLFLTHPKAKSQEQQEVWNRLVKGELKTPDTWETNLSAGKGKKATFERLIAEKNLGALALLRNLRGMQEAGVDDKLIRRAILEADVRRVLPFRFIAAAKHAQRFEEELFEAMTRAAKQSGKLPGKTIIALDRSGSMGSPLGGKSVMNRMEAAEALAMIAREMCETAVVYCTAGNDYARKHATVEVPARHGMALRDAMRGTQREIGGGGIFLAQLMDFMYAREKDADRVIVITDEQDCDNKCNPSKANAFGDRNYILNVASYSNGIAYNGKWTHVNGFSEAALRWMAAYELQGF